MVVFGRDLLPLGLVSQNVVHGVANGLTSELDKIGAGFTLTPTLKRANAHAPALAEFLFCQ